MRWDYGLSNAFAAGLASRGQSNPHPVTSRGQGRAWGLGEGARRVGFDAKLALAKTLPYLQWMPDT